MTVGKKKDEKPKEPEKKKKRSFFDLFCPCCDDNTYHLIPFQISPAGVRYVCFNCFTIWQTEGINDKDPKLYFFNFVADGQTQEVKPAEISPENVINNVKMIIETTSTVAYVIKHLSGLLELKVSNRIFHYLMASSVLLTQIREVGIDYLQKYGYKVDDRLK